MTKVTDGVEYVGGMTLWAPCYWGDGEFTPPQYVVTRTDDVMTESFDGEVRWMHVMNRRFRRVYANPMMAINDMANEVIDRHKTEESAMFAAITNWLEISGVWDPNRGER